MDPDERQKIVDSALAPYMDAIQYEREQAKYWFEHSMKISEQYNALLEQNQKLREENRKVYMKLLGLKD